MIGKTGERLDTARSVETSSGQVRLALVGFGRVGRAFVEAVAEARAGIASRHALDLRIGGIRTSTRELVHLRGELGLQHEWKIPGSFSEFLKETAANTLVQCIPSDADRAGEAFRQTVAALEAGVDVVTATKSHLVTRWAELDTIARREGRRIRISAAAGAALPAVDLARRGVRGFDCSRVRASLNGTSNFVLDEMMKARTLTESVARAQSIGIAEPDPAYDLAGRDSASKLVLIANLIWGKARSVDEVGVAGIDTATQELAHGIRARGRRLRSIGEATRDGGLSVAVREVDARDVFFGLAGAEKLVEFNCQNTGTVIVSGGESSPRGAARALLKDVVNLATGDLGPGFD